MIGGKERGGGGEAEQFPGWLRRHASFLPATPEVSSGNICSSSTTVRCAACVFSMMFLLLSPPAGKTSFPDWNSISRPGRKSDSRGGGGGSPQFSFSPLPQSRDTFYYEPEKAAGNNLAHPPPPPPPPFAPLFLSPRFLPPPEPFSLHYTRLSAAAQAPLSLLLQTLMAAASLVPPPKALESLICRTLSSRVQSRWRRIHQRTCV